MYLDHLKYSHTISSSAQFLPNYQEAFNTSVIRYLTLQKLNKILKYYNKFEGYSWNIHFSKFQIGAGIQLFLICFREGGSNFRLGEDANVETFIFWFKDT